MQNNSQQLLELRSNIIHCRSCPRLVRWREQVAQTKVPRYEGDSYWGRPVPGFGDPKARLLIVGLAPAAHGANRTGRMFTGDCSGEWLYRALHKFGFANQATSSSQRDGLLLHNCYVTAAARCAPPQNKLSRQELLNCRPFLLQEVKTLKDVRVLVALGKIAADTVYDAFEELSLTHLTRRPIFRHGKEDQLNDRQTLIISYHPSQQNTFTGKLTEKMFDSIFLRVRQIIKHKSN